MAYVKMANLRMSALIPTIRMTGSKGGQMYLNLALINKLNLTEGMSANIFYDKEGESVGLEFLRDDSGGRKLSGWRVYKQRGCVITAAPLLRFLGIEPKHSFTDLTYSKLNGNDFVEFSIEKQS